MFGEIPAVRLVQSSRSRRLPNGSSETTFHAVGWAALDTTRPTAVTIAARLLHSLPFEHGEATSMSSLSLHCFTGNHGAVR